MGAHAQVKLSTCSQPRAAKRSEAGPSLGGECWGPLRIWRRGGEGGERIGVPGKPPQVPGVRSPPRLPPRCREILERRVSETPLPSPIGNSSRQQFQGRLEPGREGSRSRHRPVAATDVPGPLPLRHYARLSG